MKNNIENLNQKIMKALYAHEKKRTFLDILKYLLLTLGLFIIIFFLVLNIVVILNEQKTFDLFDLFSEDSVIIKMYFFDVASVFLEELPKTLTILVFFSLSLLALILYFLKKNFTKIKNRLFSILKHSNETN